MAKLTDDEWQELHAAICAVDNTAVGDIADIDDCGLIRETVDDILAKRQSKLKSD